MPRTLAEELRSDIAAIQYYDSISVDLSGTFFEPLLSRLPLPSLTVVGHSQGSPGTAAGVLYRLARHAVRSGRSTIVTTGREPIHLVRATCLLGHRQVAEQARRRPPDEGPDLDTAAMLGNVAKGRLHVNGIGDDLPAGISSALRAGPVDMWLIDDVPSVTEALTQRQGRSMPPLSVEPTALRRLSRERMCAVVVVVDWRLTDAWLWERAADEVITVERDGDARPTLRSGSHEVAIPEG